MPAPVAAPIMGRRFFGVVLIVDSNGVDIVVLVAADAAGAGCLIGISGSSFVVVLVPPYGLTVLMDGATGKRFRFNVCTGVVCVGVLPLLSA